MFLTPDSAVDGHVYIDRPASLEKRRHRSEQFNAVYGLGPWLGQFFRRPLNHWSLQAAISQRHIAFAPEGLPSDRCFVLNYRIPVDTNLEYEARIFVSNISFRPQSFCLQKQ